MTGRIHQVGQPHDRETESRLPVTFSIPGLLIHYEIAIYPIAVSFGGTAKSYEAFGNSGEYRVGNTYPMPRSTYLFREDRVTILGFFTHLQMA
jgi:hypothetical protein